MRTPYNEVVLTPTGRIKRTCPRDHDGCIKVCAMGEIGERAVAQTLRNIAAGGVDGNLPDGLNLNSDDIPITTQMLVERKKMTPAVEKAVQMAGIDVIIVTLSQMEDEEFKVTCEWVTQNKHRCIQVKLQPWAPNYKSITVETCQDNHYQRNCSLSSGKQGRYTPAGINKTAAEWTAYIVSGATIVLLSTEELRKSIDGKERKHIGSSWGWSKDYPYAKRAVGTTASLLSLLQSPTSTALDIDKVFRSYLSSLTNVEDDKSEYQHYSYKLFLQDWTPSILEQYLRGGISSLTDDQVNGGRHYH